MQIEKLIEENNYLMSQLQKAKALISTIDGALPTGLESFMNEEESFSYYEKGEFL
ncbi:hypothetical protein fHeYen901_83 [Yersinia phage fHe-Yen9-01]|uniref:Uncharacterized protein n=1 Tax=Yersinia phage fHe-Yen9-01 TaxID=1965363 RepID=A0A1V0DXI0_9CAUD|nr:hypothetical protein KNT60_gp082 [Yersinia phage fHe-Yen9-01]ARB05856.1 hypothetical protein fHeYen901_83 [Yersinia phage fHe-Yen9-01]